jgi:hypothetical protein
MKNLHSSPKSARSRQQQACWYHTYLHFFCFLLQQHMSLATHCHSAHSCVAACQMGFCPAAAKQQLPLHSMQPTKAFQLSPYSPEELRGVSLKANQPAPHKTSAEFSFAGENQQRYAATETQARGATGSTAAALHMLQAQTSCCVVVAARP